MGKIAVLPEELTNRIAAGEVVERPASIVKELLENSLDAGATGIGIELRRGGCDAIRITDDGEGMEAADVPLAFSRFATSKIGRFDDLYRVRSFGFRGEALPSIAAIARVTLLTRRSDRTVGTRLVVDAGKIIEVSDCGCPSGTTLLVERIFDPVPVRKKFLKSEAAELAACLDAVTRVVLPRRNVRVRVQADGRNVLNLPATREDLERLSLLMGDEAARNLLPLSGARAAAALTGYASRTAFTRADTKQIFFYVNGRFVRDPLLQHAVMTAYRRLIEARRYPACVLNLDLPPGDVDVNVHPAKLEVRFRRPREIYALVVESLAAALAGSLPVPTAVAAPPPGTAFYASRMNEALRRYTVSSGASRRLFADAPAGGGLRPETAPPETPPPDPDPREEPAQPERLSFSDGDYLGQVFSTYLVFSHPEGLLLLDQHAAHERVLFERLRESREGGGRVVTQQLLLPEVVSLSAAEYELALAQLERFEEIGFPIEPFGDASVAVRATPALVPNLDPRRTVLDILGELAVLPGTVKPREQREKLYALLACKGAIKAHAPLTPEEVEALCRDLDAIPFASTCPHGRPTWVVIGARDLEKMFKRS